MRSANERQISNNIVLKKIEAQNPILAPKVPSLRQAYLQYHQQRGHPSQLTPVGLSTAEDEAISKIYAGETKKYDVDWIGQIRSAENTYCPLCGAPNPSQVEHYLPKAYYPEYTILSWNLVPTCAVCNPKRGHHAHSPNQTLALIHPFYEAQLLGQPLFSVRIAPPYEAVTFIPMPTQGPPELMERVSRQIRLCFDFAKLNRWQQKLWREEHAGLSGIPSQDAAMKMLQRRTRICSSVTGMNSWDTIFYRALVADHSAVEWLRETPSPFKDVV